MGIASFFPWFQQTFSQYLTYVRQNQKLTYIDNLMLDVNGLIHPVAQQVFAYGPNKQLLNPPEPTVENFLQGIANKIDEIVSLVPPRRRLLLCIDGVAPLAKQIQQRQRRYKSKPSEKFDSNSLTPGTELMYEVTKYLQEHATKYNFEVIFSGSDVPGEGEIKLIHFAKYYMRNGESAAIYGLDADIILLSLTVPEGRKMFVVRERDNDYAVVDANKVRNNIVEKLKWSNNNYKFSERYVVTDFVFMSFLIGNDFIKRAPGIDILTGSIDKIIELYKDNGSMYGHITSDSGFNNHSLKQFFVKISQLEQQLFDTKLENLSKYISDPLFNKYIVNGEFDLQNYKTEYYNTKFTAVKEKVVQEYIQGIQWILGYYTNGIPSWKWYYPFNYAPFISDIAKGDFSRIQYARSEPVDAFLQLLTVLPPHSMHLLPSPLNELYLQFPEQFPTEVEFDAGGKRHDYEAEVLLPDINNNVIDTYHKDVKLVSRSNIKYNEKSQSYSLFRNTKETIVL